MRSLLQVTYTEDEVVPDEEDMEKEAGENETEVPVTDPESDSKEGACVCIQIDAASVLFFGVTFQVFERPRGFLEARLLYANNSSSAVMFEITIVSSRNETNRLCPTRDKIS